MCIHTQMLASWRTPSQAFWASPMVAGWRHPACHTKHIDYAKHYNCNFARFAHYFTDHIIAAAQP